MNIRAEHNDLVDVGEGFRYGKAVGVDEIASAREMRAEIQAELIKRFDAPLICFTMNIAGPIKNDPLIEWAFRRGMDRILDALPADSVLCVEKRISEAGCEGFIPVRLDAERIKKSMMAIEAEGGIGRLYDIDVLDRDGSKLSRTEPRKCLICSERAAVCARSRAHSVEELQKRTHDILTDALCGYIADCAVKAMRMEVHTTPKPGLVDERNSGANADMDISTFEVSITALKPYMYELAECAARSECVLDDSTNEKNEALLKELMGQLGAVGIRAERAMLEVTGGVNTHRGAIYSLGLIVSAYALINTRNALGIEASAEACAAIAAVLAAHKGYKEDAQSNGARVRREYGVAGAREQAVAKFPLAMLAKRQKMRYDTLAKNETCILRVDPWVYGLLSIMSTLDDNNALKRGGREGAAYVKTRATELLALGESLTLDELYRFDDELIGLNISCGGAADILSVAMLLDMV